MSAFAVFLLFVAVSYAQVHDADSFSLFMHGHCEVRTPTTGNCTLKGNSQSISTFISASDAIRFEIHPHVGSYALLTSSYTVAADGTISETGTISFGKFVNRSLLTSLRYP
jgi:hypothetical protein